MNKEERMYELLKHRNDNEIKTTGLFEDIEALLDENKQLKEVINKITEIINYYGVDKEHNDDAILRSILKNMLDILKEVSDE